MIQGERGPCLDCWEWEPDEGSETYGKCKAIFFDKNGQQQYVGRGKLASQFCTEPDAKNHYLFNKKSRTS